MRELMTDTAETILSEILSLVLERSVAAGEDVRRIDEAKWDSLKHLEIVMAVEAAVAALGRKMFRSAGLAAVQE